MDNFDFDIDSDDSILDKTFVPFSDTDTASDISELSVSNEPPCKKQKTSTKFRSTSKFGDFFDYDLNRSNEKFAICKLCRNKNVTLTLKMKNSNTTGLKKHLMTRHKSEYNIMFPTPSTSSFTCGASNENNQQKQSNTNILKLFLSQAQEPQNLQSTFEDKIVDWVAVKYLPYSFFDDERTQELFNFINSNLKVPKRTALHTKVAKRYEEMKSAVKCIIRTNESNISFTIDGWTSVSNKSFYGITAHFIDDSWNLQSIVVDFLPSHGQHTGKDIAKIFISFLQEFKIENKIQGITMDNASANTKFIEELAKSRIILNAEDYHFRCFADIINLGVQDILKLIKANPDEDTVLEEEEIETDEYDSGSSINKLRILVLKIKRSEQWNNKLKSCCDTVNIPYHRIGLDISTRWNSTNDMIKIAIHMKPAINALCENNSELSHLLISESEWTILQDIHKILKHFKTVSTILGAEKYATLPLVVVGFNILIDKLEKEIFSLDNKENRSIWDENLLLAYQSGRDKLLKYYKKTNWMYCVVLILDPRHKTETFSLTSWGKELYTNSIEKFENIYKNKYYVGRQIDNTNNLSQNKLDSDDDSMDLCSFYENMDETNSDRDWKKEITIYLNSKRADKNTDILLWWKTNSDTYPTLSKMARDFLCIPATSVPAERLFSKAGLTIRKQRNRLDAESAKSLLCLNSWCSSPLYNNIKKNMSPQNL